MQYLKHSHAEGDDAFRVRHIIEKYKPEI